MPKDTAGPILPRYLTVRGNKLHYRRRVPKGAEPRFGGRREFVRTLKATNVRDARRELATVLTEFERLA
jgi:hypothetical protein